MNKVQYLSRISQLENKIEYLHGLLDNAGISYKREAKELDDLSSSKGSKLPQRRCENDPAHG